MRTVKEVSEITGVSVRTLHHYDAIGLLKPSRVTGAGYRLYDDTALCRLQNILLFRELKFPLKEIREILDNPDFDQSKAVAQQIRLLELEYKRIGELIAFAREIQSKGVTDMNFEVFDRQEIEAYKKEARERWGTTKAYQEFEKKDIAENGNGFADELMGMFSEFGGLKHLEPESDEVQRKVRALQQLITDHCYECTDEILKELGQMYVGDERFRKNIDRAGGEGTAAFVSQAVSCFCSR